MQKSATTFWATAEHPTIWKPFFWFLLPLLATNILQSLSGTINAIFVGQLLGVQSVAAVSVFFPILFFFLSFFIGLAAGSTILIGQAWGAGQLLTVKKVAGNTLALAGGLGLVIAIFGTWFTQPILEILGVPEAILPLAVEYSRIMFLGSPFLFLFIVYTSFMRGVGDTFTPMTAMLVPIATGMIATPALIQGWFGLPKLGIQAAAYASMLGFMLVLIYLTLFTRYKKHPLMPDRQLMQSIRVDVPTTKLILKLGVPAAVQMVAGSVSGLVIIGLVNHYGAHATAAYGAINQVMNYVQFPAMSIAIAASIFAAQAIGAGKQAALNCVKKTALQMTVIFTGSLIVLAYLFSERLMGLFITDPDVLALGQELLHIVLWSVLLFGAGSVFSGIMRASGTVLVPMLITVGCILLIELPCAVLFSHWYGLQGIWVAYALAFSCMCLFQWLYYQLVWRKKTVVALV
jgi:putative MATE family efflux protein